MDLELLPYLALITTGNAALDHMLKVLGMVFVGYSIFLNLLLVAWPKSKEWPWVQVSLEIMANLYAVVRRILKHPEPPCPPTLRPGPPTIPPANDV